MSTLLRVLHKIVRRSPDNFGRPRHWMKSFASVPFSLPATLCLISGSTRYFASQPTTGLTNTNAEVLRLVPNKGLISLIDSTGKFKKNVTLRKFLAQNNLARSNQKLVIVNFNPSEDPTVDAEVICKVISNSGPPAGPAKTKTSYDDKKKPATNAVRQVKPVEVSWSIGEKDLRGQKRLAIESILVKKRNKLELKLTSKKSKRHHELSALEVEQRNLLIEKCLDIGGQYGALVSREGSIYTTLTLNYVPHK